MKYLLIILSTLLSLSLYGQNSGLLQRNDVSDTYRIMQLTDSGKTKSMQLENRSFMIRPINFVVQGVKHKFKAALDQVSYSRYYNDSLGTGYNNESFFQATGWQERLSVGVKAAIGNLHINLQPELVLAQNKQQASIDVRINDGNYYSRFYFMNINVIDLPSRFGTKSIQKLFPGQSSLLYYFTHLAVGLSTENTWWGPGIRNSLVLTNQAPGFLHATIQTHQPIPTSIGTFEGQFIYGKLDSSGIEPFENIRQFAFYWPGAYVPKISEANRYLGALTITWQPKWIKNLYIGFAASRYFYNKKSDSLGRAFPDYPYTASRQDQYATSLGSIFFRYAMPEDHAEVYAEVGRADKIATPFNLFGDTIPLGYTAGLRKFFPLKKQHQFIELSAEVTHLAVPDHRLVFNPAAPFSIPKTRSWYTHPRIRQGYTHYGQTLGAGIGPGSNSQTLNISWVNGFQKLGLHVERVVHNDDFYYYQYITGNIGSGYPNRHWTDLSIGLHGQFAYKQFSFAGNITSISALNYQWVKVDGALDGPSISDKRNLHMAFSLKYSF